jgi:hypothetical protein
MLWPAAAAVVVRGRGQKAGGQMEDQTQHRGESAALASMHHGELLERSAQGLFATELLLCRGPERVKRSPCETRTPQAASGLGFPVRTGESLADKYLGGRATPDRLPA